MSEAENKRAEFEALAAKAGVYTNGFTRYTPKSWAHTLQYNPGMPEKVGDYVSDELRACWKLWCAMHAA